jgi:hypothetical protein
MDRDRSDEQTRRLEGNATGSVQEPLHYTPREGGEEVPVEMVPPSLQRDPAVAPENMERLYRAVITAAERGHLRPPQHGGILSEVIWIHAALTELEELDDLARGVLCGDVPSMVDLRTRLSGAPRWSISQEIPLPQPGLRDLTECTVRPVNPFILVGAGVIMDRSEQGETEHFWLERALGLYLGLSAAVQGVFHAADRHFANEMTVKEFAEYFELARASVPSRETPSHTDNERDPIAAGSPLLTDPQMWDPCTLGWARCAGTAARIGDDVVTAGDLPLQIGWVEPAAVCQGFRGNLTLYPRHNESFPEREPVSGGRWVMSVGGQDYPLAVVAGGWAPESITVVFPSEAAPGCANVYWRAPTPSIAERLAEAPDVRSEQCSEAFPHYRSPSQPITPQGGSARLAIVTTPRIVFSADGQSNVTADACTDVVLYWEVENWEVGNEWCTGAARREVTLLADGQVLIPAPGPLRGEMVVREETSITYELSVETFAETTSCGTASAAVTVNRRARIFLSVPDRVFHAHSNDQVPVTVRVGCPAPAGGLRVDLTSSNTNALTNAVAIIPENATETTINLSPQTPSALVYLSASASGYVGDTATVMINPTSCVSPEFTPDPRKYGGEWKVPERDGQEVSIPGVVGVHLAVLHTGEVLLFNYDEGTGGRGNLAAILECLRGVPARLRACVETRESEVGRCKAEHAQRVSGCPGPCTQFTNCDAIQCTQFTNCDAIQCTQFTNCNDFAWWDPRRYACWAARGVCVAAASVARAACFVARAVCVAAASVARAACFVARAVCVAVAEAARAICIAASLLVQGICQAAAWVKWALCAAGAVSGSAACVIARIIWTGGGILILDPENTAYTIANSSRAKCALWNPKTNAATPLDLRRNLFCSGHCFLHDGRLFVAGGQFPVPILDGSLPESPTYGRGAAHDVHLFDPTTRTWTRLPDMAEGRWYPTCVTLGDGRVMVISGNDKEFAGEGGIQKSLQIFDPTGMAIPGRPTEPFGGTFPPWEMYHLYPFAFTLPSREVFVHWKRRTATYDPDAPALPSRWRPHMQAGTWLETERPVSRTGPGPGTSVLLPFIPTRPDGPDRYPPARVMIIGGGGVEGEPDPQIPEEKPYQLTRDTPADRTAEILDFGKLDASGFPAWRYTKNTMWLRRVMPDSVLLPDGKVLVVMGAEFGRSGGFMIHFGESWGATNGANQPEIFDPETETWETMCRMNTYRLYHATAALLPDARVVVAGHDAYLNAPPWDRSEYRLEVFSPPYLFRGSRPEIRQAPSQVEYDSMFSIEVDNAEQIESVALIRQSSVTHQTNTDQRYVRLWAESASDPRKILLRSPPHGWVAPPGYYMLFVVNRSGVPSEASWVRLG